MFVCNLELDDLKGIGAVSKKRLNDAGIMNLRDLIARGPQEIQRLTNSAIEYDDATKIIDEARAVLEKEYDSMAPLISNAKAELKRRADLERIYTGCKAIDELLGGFEIGSIYEVYGEFGSGKSQLMFTLAVKAQLPKEGGGIDGLVMYIDSEGTFRPERIREIVIAQELVPLKEQSKSDKKAGKLPEPENEEDIDKFLENIILVKVLNSGHQQYILENFGTLMDKYEGKIRLLIVDSLTKMFRGDFTGGRGELAFRQSRLTDHMMLLDRITSPYNLSVVVTNQVMANPDQFGEHIKPAGGNIVAHNTTYRIYLKKSGKKHIAIIKDSPQHANNEAIYELSVAGIVDPKEEKKEKDEE